MKNKMVYIGGDLLKRGSIMLREKEAQEVRELGYKVYSPIEDKSINDKSNQSEESNNGLAEKIVRNDTRGILESDIIIIEPHENALGTMVELGQIKGYKDAAKELDEMLLNAQEMNEKDALEIFVDDDKIVLKKYEPADIFNGSMEDLIDYKGKKVAKATIIELARLAGLELK